MDVAGGIADEKELSNGDYTVFMSGFALAEAFFSKLAAHFPNNSVVFDDNIIFAQNFFSVSSGNHYYPNSGISSLGHAIPAAIGAQFCTQRPTFAILGDGGFQMCCMEIMTAVNYRQATEHRDVQQWHHGPDPQKPAPALSAALHQLRLHQSRLRPPGACSFGINYKQVTTLADLDDLFAHYDLEQAINLVDIALDKDTFPNYSSKR